MTIGAPKFAAGWQAPDTESFPDAEAAEDDAEQLFGVGFADDFADGIEGGAEFFGDEFDGEAIGEGLIGGGEKGAGAFEAGLVAGVDGDGPIALGSATAEDLLLDGGSELIEAGAGRAGNADGSSAGPGGIFAEVGFIEDENLGDAGSDFHLADGDREGGIADVQDEIGAIDLLAGAGDAFALDLVVTFAQAGRPASRG